MSVFTIVPSTSVHRVDKKSERRVTSRSVTTALITLPGTIILWYAPGIDMYLLLFSSSILYTSRGGSVTLENREPGLVIMFWPGNYKGSRSGVTLTILRAASGYSDLNRWFFSLWSHMYSIDIVFELSKCSGRCSAMVHKSWLSSLEHTLNNADLKDCQSILQTFMPIIVQS